MANPPGTQQNSSGNSNGSGSGSGGSIAAQYLYAGGFDSTGRPGVSGFRINSDGTLTAISISSPVYPTSAAKGLLLGSAGCNPTCQLSLYKINATTGDLSASASTATNGNPGVLDPSGTFAYADGGSTTNASVSAVSIASGTFSPLSGSPYQYAIGQGSNPITAATLLVDPNGHFLYMLANPQNEHTPAGIFAVVLRSPDGSLTNFAPNSPRGSDSGCTSGGLAVVPQQTVSIVFQSCSGSFESTFQLLSFIVDQSSGNIINVNGFAEPLGGLAVGIAAQSSGKWLAATDVFNNNVHILAVNSSNGGLTEASDHIFPAGTGPNAVAFDSSGKFLYVLNSGSTAAGAIGPSGISGYAFNTDTGMLTPLPGSPFPTEQSANSMVIAQL